MRTVLWIPVVALAAAACAMAGSSSAPDATAVVRDGTGRELGTLTVSEAGTGLLVTGTLRGVAPGPHGIHIHTVGRCEPPFQTAGGHWNPSARLHGFDNPQGPHAGDMQNVTVGSDSSVSVRVNTPVGTLRGSPALLDADGASIVVHAVADDYRTDPAGNSGARVACGVVTER